MRPIVLIPYRDRVNHLNKLVDALSSYFPPTDVYVIEQFDDGPFNKGAILNAGFKETQSMGDYFILHDVDQLPITGKVDYSYASCPTHISAHCSQFGYAIPYEQILGGVVIVPKEQFYLINGFPNSFRGWGGEDDMFFQSFMLKKIKVERRACWFESLDHERKIDPTYYRNNLYLLRSGRNFADGISSCEYQVVSREQRLLYNIIKIKLF